MVLSRLLLHSLLCLLGALQVLSTVSEPTGTGPDLTDVPFTDPAVQKALATAVEGYNTERSENTKYFKVYTLVKAQSKPNSEGRPIYDFTVDLVETTCQKSAGIRKYNRIQQCQQVPGNLQLRNCHFIVGPRPPQPKPKLLWNVCS